MMRPRQTGGLAPSSLGTRTDGAGVSPELAVTTYLSDAEDFGSCLDEAIAQTRGGLNLIEHRADERQDG